MNFVEELKWRGMLHQMMPGTEELLEKEGIEFVAVEPPKELKRDKKVTLDAF